MGKSIRVFMSEASVRTKIFLGILGVLALLITLSSSWLIYRLLTLKPSYEVQFVSENESEPMMPDVPPFAYKYEMEKISVQLSDKTGIHSGFVQFDLVFDCPSREAQRDMLLRRAQLRDTILEVINNFNLHDFSKPDGFEKFKDAFLEKSRTYLKENTPRGLVIKNWLVN